MDFRYLDKPAAILFSESDDELHGIGIGLLRKIVCILFLKLDAVVGSFLVDSIDIQKAIMFLWDVKRRTFLFFADTLDLDVLIFQKSLDDMLNQRHVFLGRLSKGESG